MPVFRGFLVQPHKRDFLFSFNEEHHQVITFRYLDAMTFNAAMSKKHHRVNRKRQTKEKTLCLVRIKIPKVTSKDY